MHGSTYSADSIKVKMGELAKSMSVFLQGVSDGTGSGKRYRAELVFTSLQKWKGEKTGHMIIETSLAHVYGPRLALRTIKGVWHVGVKDPKPLEGNTESFPPGLATVALELVKRF